MKRKIFYSWLLLFALFFQILSSCEKQDIDPENNLSYQIGNKKYQYAYSESPGLFGGFYRSIDASQISGGFLIYANYTSTPHNTLNISFHNTINNLPQTYYLSTERNLRITMNKYKGPDGDLYVLDIQDKNGYFKFSHVSEEYIEGSFSFKMVKADRDNPHIIYPNQSIHLKRGKFRMKVH